MGTVRTKQDIAMNEKTTLTKQDIAMNAMEWKLFSLFLLKKRLWWNKKKFIVKETTVSN